jgi:two-component system, chemotaxis family, sensor kinase CheA
VDRETIQTRAVDRGSEKGAGMMDSHREAFRDETFELLMELENALLDLEKDSGNLDLVGRIFRALHTIKGSGAMFGFDDIATLIHDVETVYDRIRNGKFQVTDGLITLTLATCDQVRRMIGEDGCSDEDHDRAAAIASAFQRLFEEPSSGMGRQGERGSAGQDDRGGCSTSMNTFRIRFRPAGSIFATGTNPMLLLQELLDLGCGRVVAHTDEIPPLENLDPEICHCWWDIILTTDRGINAIRDVFIFVEDDAELHIDPVEKPEDESRDEIHRRLGEILVERGDISTTELQNVLDSRKLTGELLVESGLVSPAGIQSALSEQQHFREQQQNRNGVQTSSLRVPSEKLDHLVNMVGELVTVQSRLSRIASLQSDPQVVRVAEDVERLVAELRDTTMSIRMVPIGTTFDRFRRLVHDLSAELGKDIRLVTEGGETELDKTVIERLNDPLVHLIRNSVDHGIESPQIRASRGKHSTGTITLSAEHSGANVIIRIRDDGAGIVSESVRARAIERGMITAEATLIEQDLFALIFQPGFSTAREVTSLSGRGVGMDVVRRNIEALQGSIQIASQDGRGTVITLKLPLTLAIIDGLLVEIGAECYVLPLSAVEECVELDRSKNGKNNGQNLAVIREDLVPFIRLRDHFRIEGAPPFIEQIVTTRIDGRRMGFVVDQVVGQHQTVIKTLGRIYKNVEEISGATILGDGRVVLILDLPKLAEKAERSMNTGTGKERVF